MIYIYIILVIVVLSALQLYLVFRKKNPKQTLDEWFADYEDLENDAYLVIPRAILNQGSKKWQDDFIRSLDELEEEIGYWKGYCVDYSVRRINKKTKKFEKDFLRDFKNSNYTFQKRK
jgi:hypothetical protein